MCCNNETSIIDPFCINCQTNWNFISFLKLHHNTYKTDKYKCYILIDIVTEGQKDKKGKCLCCHRETK